MAKNTPPSPTELEIKLRLPPGAEPVLETHPALRLPEVAAPETRQETTTYFDTPAWDLARNGISLRLRRSGARQVQTLKLRGGDAGPFGRSEWEWQVDGDSPDLVRLAETPAASLVRTLRLLEPVFTTEVRRTVRTLRSDGAVIEVALDQGAIHAGDAVEEIRELELELKEGKAAPLYQLAASLQAGLPLVLGAESKAERGWRLRTGRPRAPSKRAALTLTAKGTAAEAFRRIASTTLADLQASQPSAAAGDAEGVHQMRVAVRRLRASLVLFRPHLEPKAEARFTVELRRLGRVLGEARDWDVFCQETLHAAEEDGVALNCLAPLRDAAEAERAAAHARLAVEFGAPALTATVLGLAAWIEDPAALTGAAGDGAMGAPIAAMAPALEARLERKVRRRGRHIRRRGIEELHALRKALKKLRYNVEFLAVLHRHKRVKAYLHGCKVLQEQLGALNDSAMAVTMAEQLRMRQAELAPAVAALASWAKGRRAQALRHLPAAWRAFKAVPLPQ